jgi:hypothetical protein
MAFIPIPECAQVLLNYRLNGQECQNGFHLLHTNDRDASALQVLAALWFDWWGDEVRPHQTNDLTLQSIICRDLATENGPSIEFVTTGTTAGARTGEALPNNCASVVTWRTAQRGRSYRGRTYHLGLTADQRPSTNPNEIDPTVQVNLQAAYADAIDRFSDDATGALSVASRFLNGNPRANGILTPILTCAVDLTLDSQRRRLPGRGA